MRQLQRELHKIGLDVNVDGIYGSSTAKAVQVFQHAANIDVTGVADHPTRHLLHNVITRSAASAASAAQSTGGASTDMPVVVHHLGERIPLRRGMSGEDVTELQQLLVAAGYKVTVDGNFGPSTYHAERSFEKKTGLTVDGNVDAEDMDALRGDVAPQDDRRAGGTTDLDGGGTDTTAAPAPLAPGDRATIGSDGLAIAPAGAPVEVQEIIAAGNEIATLALPLRRRPRPLQGHRVRLLGLGLLRPARRRPARHDDGLDIARVLGLERGRRVGDRVRQFWPRVHGRRRPSLRHVGRQRPSRRSLAEGDAVGRGLHRASPRRPVSAPIA